MEMLDLHLSGNKYFEEEQYEKALQEYSKIDNSYENIHIIFSNKSACYLKINKYVEALNYGLKSVEKNLKYATAWARVGSAYKGLKKFNNAYQSYKFAAYFNPNSELYKNEIINFSKKFDLTPSVLYEMFLNDGKIMERCRNVNFKNMILWTKNPLDLITNHDLHDIMKDIINNLKIKED